MRRWTWLTWGCRQELSTKESFRDMSTPMQLKVELVLYEIMTMLLTK